MKEYNNYIFDLYGTLVDIEVDEKKAELWDGMAAFYNVYGCDYAGSAMRDIFFKMDDEERIVVEETRGFEHAEIKLERVYSRLLFECADTHPVSLNIAGIPIETLRKDYRSDKEKVIELVQDSDWCVAAANLFRILSRSYLRLFEGTLKTLDELKRRGKKIFLLSNAQKVFTQPEIEAMELTSRFDEMYISSDHYVKKPNPKFMDILIDKEGIDRDASVMVGNEVASDVALALFSDMDCVLLNTAGDEEKTLRKKINKLIADREIPYKGEVKICEDISGLIK